MQVNGRKTRGRRRRRRNRRKELWQRLTAVLLAGAAGICLALAAVLLGKTAGMPAENGAEYREAALQDSGEVFRKNQTEKTDGSSGIFEESSVLRQLEELGRTDARAAEIAENPSLYPEELLELAVKNSEALDFVLDYPEKKNRPADRTIGELRAGEIPLLIQWDERWGYTEYGSGLLGYTGCGPTALAMVAAGLTGNTAVTPACVAEYAEENGYYEADAGTAWSLMLEGCEAFGVRGCELPLSEEQIREELEAGNPVICSVGPGDFTDEGHFIVLVSFQAGKIRVNDPNSRIRSERLWTFGELEGQIKNLWSFTAYR